MLSCGIQQTENLAHQAVLARGVPRLDGDHQTLPSGGVELLLQQRRPGHVLLRLFHQRLFVLRPLSRVRGQRLHRQRAAAVISVFLQGHPYPLLHRFCPLLYPPSRYFASRFPAEKEPSGHAGRLFGLLWGISGACDGCHGGCSRARAPRPRPRRYRGSARPRPRPAHRRWSGWFRPPGSGSSRKPCWSGNR